MHQVIDMHANKNFCQGRSNDSVMSYLEHNMKFQLNRPKKLTI